MTRSKVERFRFGVGSDEDGYSSVWLMCRDRNDVYLGIRDAMGMIKIDFHEDGNCFLMIGKEFHEDQNMGPGRALVAWKRPKTKQGGVSHVASLVFPTGFLKGNLIVGKESKKILWIQPAPDGRAVEIGVFFTYEKPAIATNKYLGGVTQIFSTKLLNGQNVLMAGQKIDFDSNRTREKFSHMRGKAIRPELGLDPGESITNATFHFYNSPKDGETFWITEIGGLNVSNEGKA